VVFMWRLVKKLNNFTILPDLKKIIIAVIGMALTATLLKYAGIMVIANMIISGVFYLFLLYLLKEKNFQELLSLVNIKSKI